jgi:hypothetical protein
MFFVMEVRWATHVLCSTTSGQRFWGIGINQDMVASTLEAVCSAVSRFNLSVVQPAQSHSPASIVLDELSPLDVKTIQGFLRLQV